MALKPFTFQEPNFQAIKKVQKPSQMSQKFIAARGGKNPSSPGGRTKTRPLLAFFKINFPFFNFFIFFAPLT